MPELQNISKRFHGRFAGSGLTLAAAESCTGGLVSCAITDNPGSSAYFLGGVVSYANSLKTDLLGVSAGLVLERGAVDPRVAIEMAEGVRRLTGANYAVSATGIAGPDGGSDEKPVRLVYIGVAGPYGAESREYRFEGGRRAVREATARRCLEFLLEHLDRARSGISE